MLGEVGVAGEPALQGVDLAREPPRVRHRVGLHEEQPGHAPAQLIDALQDLGLCCGFSRHSPALLPGGPDCFLSLYQRLSRQPEMDLGLFPQSRNGFLI